MKFSRRSVLRGALRGVGVGVALPLLDCFLDGNGKAFADTGQRVPMRFGTWIWGCGFIPELWIPASTGTDYTLPAHLAPLQPYRERLAVLSGFDVKLDGVANKPHVTGCFGLRTGIPVPDENVKAPTLDVMIGDVIGEGTRFRSIELSTNGIERSYSYRMAGAPNPAEISPLRLYTRIFGEGFQDPNSVAFTPDPRHMVHHSVLSAVRDEREQLMRQVGAADRQRLQEYFDGIRQLEQQVAMQLQPPLPVRGFVIPDAPQEAAQDAELGNVMENHRLMAGLLARALQCNQTRVFNVLFSDTASNLRREGSTSTHHTLTHEEPVDATLGYQPQVCWFAEKSMLAWRDFLDALAAIPEGDGTLLDNCLVLAHSDCSIAKAHAVEGIPVMLAGGRGKIRTGQHLAGNGDPVSRIGLTIQQAMGVQVDRWGTLSMETDRTLGDLLA